jgi:Ca2+-binding RTX toxin-like protein
MKRLAPAVLCALAFLTAAPDVFAATAVVGPSDAFPGLNAVRYIADAGEANSVTIRMVFSPSFALEIVDEGATITAGSGCSSLAANTARCAYDYLVEVELGDGNDVLSLPDVESEQAAFDGGDGDDTIDGAGNVGSREYFFGGPGNDVLRGHEGEDVLDGGLGADTLRGGSSWACELAGICPAERDTLTYAGRTNDVFVDADGVADDGEALEGDMVRDNFELIVGGSGDDVLSGSITNSFVEGKAFPRGTTLEGGPGSDVLRGGPARDFLLGRGGNDVVRGNRTADILYGNRGNDRLIGGGGQDSMWGKGGNDRLIGGRGQDDLLGGRGPDLLLAREGRQDRVNGGFGFDQARIDSGLDRVRRVESILP